MSVEFSSDLPLQSPSHLSSSSIVEENTGEVGQPDILLSRRRFLQAVGAVGINMFLEHSAPHTPSQSQRSTSFEADTAIKDTGEQKDVNEISLHLQTTREQLIMTAAKVAVGTVCKKWIVDEESEASQINKKNLQNYYSEKPVVGLLKIGVVMPIVEELLFRFLPSYAVGRNDKKLHWEVGLPVAGLFALLHNAVPDDNPESSKIHWSRSIPLPEFMGGAFYWHLIRKKGFSHAALAHIVHNTTAVLNGIVRSKIVSEENTGGI